jgi:hypothetical protein
MLIVKRRQARNEENYRSFIIRSQELGLNVNIGEN